MGESLLTYDQIFRAFLIGLEFSIAFAVGYWSIWYWFNRLSLRQDAEAEYMQKKIDG